MENEDLYYKIMHERAKEALEKAKKYDRQATIGLIVSIISVIITAIAFVIILIIKCNQ